MDSENIRQTYIALLEEGYANKLRDVGSVPEDLGNKYVLWLRGKIQQAMQLQQQTAQPAEEEENNKKSA